MSIFDSLNDEFEFTFTVTAKEIREAISNPSGIINLLVGKLKAEMDRVEKMKAFL